MTVRARFAEASRADETTRAAVDAVRRLGCVLLEEPSLDAAEPATDRFCRLVVRLGGVPSQVVLEVLEAIPGVFAHSIGRCLEIVKDLRHRARASRRRSGWSPGFTIGIIVVTAAIGRWLRTTRLAMWREMGKVVE